LGLAGTPPFPGRSLARAWDAKHREGNPSGEPLLMEAEKPRGSTNQGREPVDKGPMKALVAEGMHYIRRIDGLEELYLLKSDPDEQNNLAIFAFASEPLRRFRTALVPLFSKKK
jgi:hypothetical protein